MSASHAASAYTSPVVYPHHKVGVVDDGWVFSKLVIGDNVLHELLYGGEERESNECQDDKMTATYT